MIPMMRAASMPSRSPMIRFGIIPTAATSQSPNPDRHSARYRVDNGVIFELSVNGIWGRTKATKRAVRPVRMPSSPVVHRSAAVSEEIDRDVQESGIADRAGDLFGGLGGDDTRDIRSRHLDPGDPIVGPHAHDSEA